MSGSVNAPFGLRPAWHPSGVIRQAMGTLESGYATNIFQYSPVALATTGFITVAAAGARAIGVFMGVEYTGTDGIRRLRNTWPANTVATEIVVYYTQDPQIVYEIQANAALSQAAIGEQYNWSALAGSTVTGLSSVSLDVATAAGAGVSAGLRVIGYNPAGGSNLLTDDFPLVQVQISEHQYVADIGAV